MCIMVDVMRSDSRTNPSRASGGLSARTEPGTRPRWASALGVLLALAATVLLTLIAGSASASAQVTEAPADVAVYRTESQKLEVRWSSVQVLAWNLNGDGDPVETTAQNSPSEFAARETGARSVDENTDAGTDIGAPVAADDADSDSLTYSISGADAAAFQVDASSGQLRTLAALDYETQSSYSFTMSVHDGKDVDGNDSASIDATIGVTVTVNNVDEPATVWLSPARLRVADVIRARISDPDADPGYLNWFWYRSTDKTTWMSFEPYGQRLERPRHPGLGVPVPRPVPGKVVRHVGVTLGRPP